MLDGFWSSWGLFAEAWTTGLLLGAMLPLAGVVLVAREQVFLSAAIGQAATFGIALAFALQAGERESGHADGLPLASGVLAAIAATVLTTRDQSRRVAGLQSRAAWLFLAAGSGAVLLLTHEPHGLAEVHALMLSSLLGASPADVVTAAVLLLLAIVALACARDRILLWTIDPEGARVLGVRTLRWDVASGVAIGIATGFAIHAAGLLFTFGATVLPVLSARRLGRSLAGVLLLAPVAGLGATLAGLVAGHSLDLPPGQAAVAAMALLLAGASVVGRLRG